MRNKIRCIILVFLMSFSCSDSESNDESLPVNEKEVTTLDIYTENRIIETGSVIGCAGSAQNNNNILAFYYNEEGSSNHRFYETETVNVDNSNFSNYERVILEINPFFNGALGMFTRSVDEEKWIILTYELDGEIKLSNPIRSKQNTKPTIYSEVITIDQNVSSMPNFIWADNPFGDNAIYFEIVSDTENNLLSGTYTFDNHFQYYDTSNVVLNITKGIPQELEIGEAYNFTLMDVSEDSWVNFLTLNQNFIIE